MSKEKNAGLLNALRFPDFRRLMMAFAVSAAGSWAYNVGLAVFVFEQTHSPAWVGAATIGRFVPSLLFGAYGGVLAERFERVKLMVSLDLVCAMLMTVLTVIVALKGPVLLAIVFAGLNSMISMMYQPAVAAITPQAVPERELAAANALTSTVENVDTVQFVVLSEERLGTGAKGYGYLLAGLGVGGIAAAALVNRISSWPRLGTAILTGMAIYCLPTLLFLSVDQPVAAFFIEAVRGAGTLVVDILAITALQRSLPPDRMARVFGAFFTLVLTAISLGALVMPQVLAHTSLDTSLWLAGALLPALCALGWPWLRAMDNANVAHLAEITPRIIALERAGILAEASRAILERLASGATEVDVPTGQTVVTEGEQADAFYVLVSGAMTVRSHGATTVEHPLPGLTAGDYFGEIGLIEHIPRTATVAASEPSTVLRIEGDDFLDALTSATASPSLLEGARTRLARTPTYRPPVPDSLVR